MKSFKACLVILSMLAGAASATIVLESGQRLIHVAISAPDRDDLEAITVAMCSEIKLTNRQGFVTFVEKKASDIFEEQPFSKKMKDAIATKENPAYVESTSPLISKTSNPDRYYILITKRVIPVGDGLNNITGFKQPEDEDHFYVSCVMQNSQNPHKPVVIKKRSLAKKNFVFPADRTVVIMLDPKKIDRIQYRSYLLKPHYVQLPEIVLKSHDAIKKHKQKKKGKNYKADKPQCRDYVHHAAVVSALKGMEMGCSYDRPQRTTAIRVPQRGNPIEVCSV